MTADDAINLQVSKNRTSNRLISTIVAGVLGGIVCLAIIGIGGCLWWKKRKNTKGSQKIPELEPYKPYGGRAELEVPARQAYVMSGALRHNSDPLQLQQHPYYDQPIQDDSTYEMFVPKQAIELSGDTREHDNRIIVSRPNIAIVQDPQNAL